MMNPSVISDVEADLSGGFKRWLTDICVENVERKFGLSGGALALDRAYKYPKVSALTTVPALRFRLCSH